MRWVPLRDLQEVVKFFTIVILTSLRNLSAFKSSFFLEWCLWGNNRIIGAVYFYTTPVEVFPIFPFSTLCHVYLTICQLYTMRCWKKVRFQREMLNRNCDFRTHYWYMEYVDSTLCHFAETSSDLRVRLPLRNDLSPTTAIRLQTHYYFNCILRI